jgi:nitroreductase
MELISKNTSTEFQYPINELIKNRKSIRAFKDQPIETEKINSLFEAVRWAPSSVNEQPWLYVYATKDQHPELWKQLFDALNEGNKLWAKEIPLFILSLVRTVYSGNDRINTSAQHDLGLANAFLCCPPWIAGTSNGWIQQGDDSFKNQYSSVFGTWSCYCSRISGKSKNPTGKFATTRIVTTHQNAAK